jgi:hypothetical protein
MMKRSLELREANDSLTIAAMYAKATEMDTAQMAGAEGFGG